MLIYIYVYFTCWPWDRTVGTLRMTVTLFHIHNSYILRICLRIFIFIFIFTYSYNIYFGGCGEIKCGNRKWSCHKGINGGMAHSQVDIKAQPSKNVSCKLKYPTQDLASYLVCLLAQPIQISLDKGYLVIFQQIFFSKRSRIC